MTFVPCFVWIFAFAPAIERLAGRPRLGAALQGVTAAVVGVIASLALWFALHVLFARLGQFDAGPLAIPLPDPASVDAAALLLVGASGLLLLWRRWPMLPVLALAALAGAAVAG